MKKWQGLMAEHEKRVGLPAGMLASLVQQETGGQKRFMDDPAAFHYAVGPNGEKPKSSARGLGGILEGTAKNPGYGVTPLRDWSVPEQLRFMADYVKARGVAAYGEGAGYERQVMGRLGQGKVVQAPVQVAAQAVAPPVDIPVEQVAALPVQAPEPVYTAPQAMPEWQEFQRATQGPVQVADLNFDFADFKKPVNVAKNLKVDFSGFMPRKVRA